MRPRSSARFRIFLVFAALALALVGGLQLALWAGAAQAQDQGLEAGLAFAGLVGTGMILLASLVAWLYCDERLAKPLERQAVTPPRGDGARTDLASGEGGPPAGLASRGKAPALREGGHTGGEAAPLEEMRRLERTVAGLESEKAHLGRVLGEIPVAVIVVNADHRIVLYDSQAADLLGRTAPPRLNARLSRYFDNDILAGARDRMLRTGLEVRFAALPGPVTSRIDARMRPLEDGGAIVILEDAAPCDESRVPGPLVYDFELLEPRLAQPIADMPLSALTFVVLCTETSGLLPHRDDLLRIGAVRMTGARILRGETLDLRIDAGPRSPDRPQRRDRPDVLEASAHLYDFARNAVIVAHNAPLRMAFLRRHDAATGLKWTHPQIDLVLLSALLFGDRADHSLRALAHRTGTLVPRAYARGGTSEAMLVAEIFGHLVPLLGECGIDSLEALRVALDHHARSLEKIR